MVEGTVGVLTTWIIAALRNRQFMSLRELNEAVRDKLEEFNTRPFQKRPGNRKSAFDEEKLFLIPLPARSYEMAEWRVATVQLNYHIAVEKMNYSVPFEYISRKVDIRMTKNMVEVFYGGNRIASHVRLYGQPNQYTTVVEHMPENHQQYTKWNAEQFIAWAKSIGEYAEAVVKALLSVRTVEQQSYKSCIALLKLADKYSVSRLESACRKALSYSPNPSLKSVQTILKTGSDKISESVKEDAGGNSSAYGFVRGASYYGGGKS
jgi:hypothetical protein